jgi:hypothetical protein
MAAPGYVEGYVRADHLQDLVADYLLVPAEGPENVLLRTVSEPLWQETVPWLMLVADLADGGPREAQQARILLEQKRDDG